MTHRHIELIVAPFEVDRADSAMARAPDTLLRLGLLSALGPEEPPVHRVTVDSAASSPSQLAAIAVAIAERVASARDRGRLPVVLSGGCLASLGVVAGLHRGGLQPAVLWIDAHGDFHDEASSRSGYVDGMALAALCGLALPDLTAAASLEPVPTRHVVHLGARDLDPPEIERFAQHDVLSLPPQKVDAATPAIVHHLAGRELYLHIDLDGLDPEIAPAVHYPVAGGLTLDEVAVAVAAAGPVAALTFSALDFDDQPESASATTLQTVVRLIVLAAGI